jgi:hypothetical protein
LKNIVFKNKIVIFVVGFDPIRIYTCLAPQNDRLNLSFVNDIHVDAMPKNDHKWSKMAIIET